MIEEIKSIKETVAENLISSLSAQTGLVRQKVVEHYSSIAIEKRANAVIKTMDKIDELGIQVKKIKPDRVVYDESGVEVSSGFSKEKIDERKKLLEQIEKLKKALDKAALDNYDDVFNV
jgi:hypothetical protein